jgi:NADPH2:quinone reductase
MGARVIAAASSEARTALCRDHGAHETIDYSQEDLRARIKELTDGRGVDVAYDPVGGDYAELAVRSMAWKGRYLVIGFAAGDIPKIPLNLPLLKGCDLVGVFWGDFVRREPEAHRANVGELMDWWGRGVLRPHVSKAFPLDRAAAAITHLAERRATGKVVVVTDAGRAAHPDLDVDVGA